MTRSPTHALCNPATAWIDGSTRRSYTFVPGDTLYWASFCTSGYQPFNALLMANDEEHVRNILLGMVKHFRRCAEEYTGREPNSRVPQSVKDWHVALEHCLRDRANTVPEWSLQIVPAPLNQLFKAAWASNDTF